MKPFCENKNRSIALRAQRCILNIAFVAAATIASGFHFRATGKGQSASPTSEPHNNISEMTRYTEQGRYDEAVQLGLAILRNDPSDELVYQQIADVFYEFVRRKIESDENNGLQTQFHMSRKSLSLNSKDKDVAGVHLFMDALSFELAGDLSVEKRCTYYDRARRLLEDRV